MNKHIYRPALLLAALLLLPGCFGGRTPPPRLYTLAPASLWDNFESRDLDPSAPLIDILPVALPRHLDRPQIVTLSASDTDTELDILEFHRWGAPLDASIRELLAAELLSRLPTATIDLYPTATAPTPPSATVSLRILRMEGLPGATVDLLARWEITLPGASSPTLLGLAHNHAATADASIPAYVRALREAVTALSDDIADHLSSLLPAAAAPASSESGPGPHRRAAASSKSTRKPKD